MLRTPTNRELVALSAPTFAFTAFEVSQTVLLPAYLTTHVGIPVALAGTLLMAARLFDMVMDVVCGTLADLDLFPAIGRRRAWMLLGVPLALLGCTLLYRLPPGTPWPTAAALIVLAASGWTLINASHGAWALEAATELTSRSRIFAGRGLAGLAGYLALTGVLSLTHDSAAGHMQVSLLFLWIAAPLTIALLFLGAPERNAYVRAAGPVNFRMAWLATVASPRRRHIGLLFALVGAHAAVVGGSYVFFVRHGLALPQLMMPGLLCQALFTGLGLVLGVQNLRVRSPKTVLIMVFAVKALVAAVIPVLPPANAVTFFVWVSVGGFVGGIDFMLLRALAGEELDLERSGTGHAPAGVFYAAFHAPYNIAGALLTGFMFWALSATGFSALESATGGEAIRWVPAALALTLASAALVVSTGLGAPKDHDAR